MSAAFGTDQAGSGLFGGKKKRKRFEPVSMLPPKAEKVLNKAVNKQKRNGPAGRQMETGRAGIPARPVQCRGSST